MRMSMGSLERLPSLLLQHRHLCSRFLRVSSGQGNATSLNDFRKFLSHWRQPYLHHVHKMCLKVECSMNFGSETDTHGTESQSRLLLPLQHLVEASIVYCTAPALGHNQESHPESNERVLAILEALEKSELTPKAMKKACEEGLIFVESSGPTYATSTTFVESMLAAGAGIALIDSVVAAARKTMTPPLGFALVRPPGHHAVPAGPMGFCIFGNIAIAARYAQRMHGLKRVFVIDFDVHHGNGTSDAFYEDPNVFFLSTHQAGSYPGTGKMQEVGIGGGEGTTLNLPLPGGSGDETMSAVWEEIIVPAAKNFKPEIILVSAGYDAHVLDPLAGLQFTTGTYYKLACNIKKLAQELCGGRCVFFLEGGYDLKSLSNSVADTFRAFLGNPSGAFKVDNPAVLYDEPLLRARKAIDEIKSIHSL